MIYLILYNGLVSIQYWTFLSRYILLVTCLCHPVVNGEDKRQDAR